ncbi:MAG: aminotransferase class III-fold pyridoxal phosphate-dependent enzyme [Halobacteriovoraceae bacterium]|nr:aminotransferase class III-fold pyridoxal phosphate-dependent enzyme [Halobacteriovoraceae bacterium]
MNTDQIIHDSLTYTFFPWGKQGNLNPVAIKRANGVYLWDNDDKKYVDFSSGLILTNIGHGDKRVIHAITEQLEKVPYVAPFHTTPIKAEVGKLLAEITPGDLTKTFFTLGGADANENAMKIARSYTGKQKIITRWRSYHGGTYAAATAGGDPRRHLNNIETPWIIRIPDPYYYRSSLYKNLTPEQGDEVLIDMLEERIMIENPDTVAAIMLEGFSGSSGIINPHGMTYWKRVREICDKYNILLIDDEVMSGFGRTGKWFGIENYDVTPDIMVMAKGITSGYVPLGAVIVNEKIAKHFDDNVLNCGLTYGAHATALAAAKATINIYKEDGLIQKAQESGEYLDQRLNELKDKYDIIGDARGKGLLWLVELVKDRKTKEPLSPWGQAQSPAMIKIAGRLRELGFSTLIKWNWIFIAPPLIIDQEDLDYGLSLLDQVLQENS